MRPLNLRKAILLILTIGISITLFAERGKMTKNKTTMTIGMTSVYVKDINKAFKFYTEILGFIEVLYQPESNLAIVASPQDKKGTSLLLEPNDNPIAKKYQKEIYQAGLPALVLNVEDIQYEYKRLKNLGVKFAKKPSETDWGILAIFDDSCGNLLQLFQNN